MKAAKKLGSLALALPHALFAAMYEANKVDFASIMYKSDPKNLELFWDSQQDHPAFRDHCMHNHPYYDFRKFAIPMSLHGDEVATVGCGKAWAKLSHCISWSSLLVHGKPHEKRHIIFQIYPHPPPSAFARKRLLSCFVLRPRKHRVAHVYPNQVIRDVSQ